jgi:hypothetical protein
MFLYLRWYKIDVDGFRLRPVNVLLPSEDIDRLETIKKNYNVPYGEFFIRAIFYLRRDIWEHYRRWNRLEMRKNLLPYRRKRGTYDSESKYRGYVVREQLDEKVQEIIKNRRFDPKIRFNKFEAGKKSRICFRIKNGDIKVLNDLSKGEVSLGTCLHYIINRTMGIYRKKDGETFVRQNRLIKGYKPHSKITFTVRHLDCRSMDIFMRQYRIKYSEKLTKSEIVALAYHLFKRMGLRRQEVARIREKKEGKGRGRSKKISVSFSYESKNYWETHEPSPTELRAALYSLLRSKKFWALVGINPFEYPERCLI